MQGFCDAIESLPDTQVHVHCIYNARVTAFFYRYAKTGRGIPEAEAHALMDGIWRPGNDWAEFIGSEDAVGQPKPLRRRGLLTTARKRTFAVQRSELKFAARQQCDNSTGAVGPNRTVALVSCCTIRQTEADGAAGE